METPKLTMDEVVRKLGGVDLARESIHLMDMDDLMDMERHSLDVHRKNMDEVIAKKNGHPSRYRLQGEDDDLNKTINIGDRYYPAPPQSPQSSEPNKASTLSKIALVASLLATGAGGALVMDTVLNRESEPVEQTETETPYTDSDTKYGLRVTTE